MTHRLTLYITGRTHSSECAVANLRRIMEQETPDIYEITIVDVAERPDAAELNRILATPTLIRESPPPIRRIVGDMSDALKVLQALGLNPESALKVRGS